MATRKKQKPPSFSTITTTEIKDELVRAGGNNNEFFYIYVSTAGKDPNPPQAPPQLPSSATDREHVREEMEVDNQQTTSTNVPPTASPEQLKKQRKEAMKTVHDFVLPEVLGTGGWQKVVDKDGTSTYRAIYFKIIPKEVGESDKDHIKRIARVKEIICDEVKKVKQQYNNPNFKTNCLLSKPFLYDGMALDEIC